MKKINTFLLGAAFISALASCEMKEELSGGRGHSGEMGLLDLTVATNSASTTVTTRATDNVEEFPVTITGIDVDCDTSFVSFADLKEKNPIELPVGKYTVVAQSPGEYGEVMTEPFYRGTQEITVSNVTATQTVTCSIQNVKIAFSPSATFREMYASWEVNVTDQRNHAKTFTEANSGTDSDPAFEYWKLADDVDKIYINGTAVLKNGGETVSVSGVAEKSKLPGHTENDGTFFKGGDELVITLEPDKIEGSVAGVAKDVIVITISGFNSETNQDFIVDVDLDGEDPGDTPGGGDPVAPITISDNGTGYLTNGVTVVDGEYPTDVAVLVNAKNGIKNVYVKIKSTNSTFEGLVGDMGLVDGDGMDLAAESSSSLSSLFPLPEVNATEYKFEMSSTLFGLLGNFSGKHDFQLTVIDQADPANSETVTLTINN